MAHTFNGPAPRGIYPHNQAAFPPPGGPRPDFYGQAWQPPHASGYAGQFGTSPMQPMDTWTAPNVGPAGASGPWGVPPTSRGLGRRGVAWIAASGGVALTIAAAVIVGIVTGHGRVHGPTPAPTAAPAPQAPAVVPAPPPPAPALVEDTEILRMLPLEAYVTQVVGAAALQPIDKLNGPGLFDDGAAPAECVNVVMPAAKAAYTGSGVRATYTQALHDPDRSALHVVFNAVSTFNSEAAASRFVTSQSTIWQGCQANPIALDPGEAKPTTWIVKEVAQRGNVLTARTYVNGGGPRCQRALTTKLNVVVDVEVCAENWADAAATLAADTVGRVGQAT